LRSACQIFFALECDQLSYEQQFFLFVKAKYPSRSTTVVQVDRLWRHMLKSDLAQHYALVDHDQRFWQEIQQSLGFFAEKKAPYFVDYTIQLLQRYGYSDDRYQTAFDSTLYDRIEILLQQLRPYLLQKKTTDMCVVVLEDKKIASMNLLRQYGGGKDQAFLNGCLQKRQV
jgi:hypothetical protein